MSDEIYLKYKKLNSNVKSPEKSNDVAAGIDIFSSASVRITGNTIRKIPTGIRLNIPEGYHVEIKERSGLSAAQHLTIKAGIIDQDYRGEILVVMENTGYQPFIVDKNLKIAQLVLYKDYPSIKLKEDDTIDTETDRGEDGFGSSDEK